MLGGGGEPAAVKRELVLLRLSPPSDPLKSLEMVLARALPPRDALRDSDERDAESRSDERPREDESAPPEVAVDDERADGDPKVIARMTAAAMRWW